MIWALAVDILFATQFALNPSRFKFSLYFRSSLRVQSSLACLGGDEHVKKHEEVM